MYGYKYFKSFLFLIFTTILFSCGGDEDMTLINSENFTGFGNSPFKVMKIYEKDVSVLGNNLAETDPLNLTEFNEALYNTQHNVAFLSNGVTTDNASLTFTDYTSLQDYLSAINHNDYNIAISVDGSGYSGNDLLIENIKGSGQIGIIWGTATDDLANIKMEKVDNNIIMDRVESDSAASTAFEIVDCKRVDLTDVVAANTSVAVSSKNSFVTVDNIKIGSGVSVAFVSDENSFINVESADPTSSTISNVVYRADNGGRISKMNNLNIFTSGSDFESTSSGGIISGRFGLGTVASTTTTTIQIITGTTTEEANQMIINAGPNVPENVKLRFDLSTTTYTGTAPLTISNFYGGGEIELEGNGTGSILPGLKISENSVKINTIDFDITGTSSTDPLLQDTNNLKRVEYNDINITDSGTEPCMVVDGSPNVYVLSGAFAGDIGIQATNQAHVVSNNTSGANTTYGLNAEYGGVISKIGTQPTGGTSNEFTSNAGIIR